MKKLFLFIIFGFLFIRTMDKPTTGLEKSIKIPRPILEVIFETNDARIIAKKINQLVTGNGELRQFMQSDENVAAVINHISKKTDTIPVFSAFYLGKMGRLRNEYAQGTLTKAQIDSLLDIAFANSDIDLIAQLVNEIPSLSRYIFNNREKTTFLLRALKHAQGLPLVKALIENGADVDKADAGGLTPLVYAINHNRTEALKELLAAGADVNKKTTIGLPLYLAVKLGSVEAVKLLLNAGADINEQILQMAENNNGSFNKEEIRKMLHAKKANPHMRFSTLSIKL